MSGHLLPSSYLEPIMPRMPYLPQKKTSCISCSVPSCSNSKIRLERRKNFIKNDLTQRGNETWWPIYLENQYMILIKRMSTNPGGALFRFIWAKQMRNSIAIFNQSWSEEIRAGSSNYSQKVSNYRNPMWPWQNSRLSQGMLSDWQSDRQSIFLEHTSWCIDL